MSQDKKPWNWLVASDIDDTLLGEDDTLPALVKAIRPIRDHIVLAYNSSRPCTSQMQSLAEHVNLPNPDYLIGALGTEIQRLDADEDFSAYTRQFSVDWRRDEIVNLMESLGFPAHDEQYQTSFKASYHVPGRMNYLLVKEHLRQAGLKVRVIFSSDRDLDIIPEGMDKGAAVEFLRRRLGLNPDQVVVAGDSANDRDVYLHNFRGIVVANADSQLKSLDGPGIYHAQKSHAGGVLEGLQYWGVITQVK